MILSLPLATLLGLCPPAQASPARPNNIILLLVDGLSWGQWQLTYDAARDQGKTLALQGILDAGHTAYCETTPLGALVAESGAASSAIATGRKVANRTLAQLPDATNPPNIFELAHKDGRATGLITTGRLTHATPAAFLVHLHLRDDEYDVARQIVDSGVDVLFGGGRDHFLPSMLAKMQANGYSVLFHANQLEDPVLPRGKLLGLFAEDSFPYALDQGRKGAEEVPTLTRMTRKALDALSRGGKGFVLVVDSRLVDEASHYHDAAAVLAEMTETDRTAAALLEFYRAHPETQIIVTANHDTAGMGMEWRANPAQFGGRTELERIRAQKASFHAMFAELWRREQAGEKLDAGLVRLAVLPNLAPDIRPSDRDFESVAQALSLGPKKLPFAWSPALHALANVLEPYYLMTWATGTHTSSPVPCFGIGPGTEGLRGLLDNTDIFRLMRRASSGADPHQ